jgi:hypothetical protein
MKKAFLLFLFLSFFKVFSQQNDFKNFNGKWKLSEIHSYNEKTKIYFSEILVIENNQIYFSKSQNAESVNLNFQLLVHPEKYIDNQLYKMIKLENGEIWELEFREINNQKRIIWKCIKDSEGDSWIQLDERSIIRDSEKRKKALEGEINTYYTKIE